MQKSEDYHNKLFHMIPNNRIEIDRSQKWKCSKLRWDKNKFEVKDEIWSTIHSNGYQLCHECRNEENWVPPWQWILALFFLTPDSCLWFRKRTSITPTVIPTVAFCCSFNSFDIFPTVSLYKIYTGVFFSSLFYCEWLLLFYTVDWLINIGWMFTKTFSMLHFRLEWQENQNVNAKKWKIPWGIFRSCNGIPWHPTTHAYVTHRIRKFLFRRTKSKRSRRCREFLVPFVVNSAWMWRFRKWHAWLRLQIWERASVGVPLKTCGPETCNIINEISTSEIFYRI